MNRRRTALVSAGVAAATVAGGLAARTIVRRRRGPADGRFDRLPDENLGPVASFDGTALAVRAAGADDAPALVFAHGFSLDLTTWHEQWTELSGDHRCVLFDFRSHGRSEPAAGSDLSLAALGHDLAAVLEAAVPGRPAVVVGHSMGGMALLALAESEPGLFGPTIAGVVLVGTAAADLVGGAMGSVAELLRPRLGTFRLAARRVDRVRRAILAGPRDVPATVARLTQFGPDAPPHLVDHIVALAGRARREVWVDALARLMQMDLRHALGHVAVPALVIVGEHDRVTPPGAAVEMVGALPEGRLAVIEGAGHLPMLERPHEVNEKIRAFAAEVLPRRRRRRPA
jgi:pimeloyl-ACP methyl ester carboxylesterase